jgi:hypothetical protein
MAYSIQLADLTEHKELLISLWKNNFQEVSPGRFSWIYENNPNGPPTVFLLKHEESQLFVGAMAIFPRPIMFKGRTIRSYICGDMVVDNQHRSLGPALYLFKAALKQCDKEAPCVLLSLPSNKSQPVALRAGYKVIGDFCEFIKVLKTRKYLLRSFNSPVIAAAFAWPLDVLLRWRNDVFLISKARRYGYEILSEFDERFDNLLERLKNDFVFIGERNRDYLKWRTRDSPYGTCDIFSIFTKKDKVTRGYVAFYRNDLRVNIVDLAFCDGVLGMRILLALFCRYMQTQMLDSISISMTSNPVFFLGLKKIGFAMRNIKNKAVLYASLDKNAIVNDMINCNWYITTADNDI